MLSFPFCCCLFSCSVVSDSLWLHGLQHARLTCPLLSRRICSNSCPSTFNYISTVCPPYAIVHKGLDFPWWLVTQGSQNQHPVDTEGQLQSVSIQITFFFFRLPLLKSRDITLPTKVCLVKAMVFPVVMYGCEIWTIKKAEHRRVDAFELWCWKRLLRVPWSARRFTQSILK